jgi:hypothetical protein
MTPYEVIRSAIPLADDNLCHDILWTRTPFPCGGISARSLYKAATTFDRAAKNKRRLCDFCDNLAQPGRWACAACDRALHKVAS